MKFNEDENMTLHPHLGVPQSDHALIRAGGGHRVEQVETVEGDVDPLDVILTWSAEYGQTPASAQVPKLRTEFSGIKWWSWINLECLYDTTEQQVSVHSEGSNPSSFVFPPPPGLPGEMIILVHLKFDKR